MNKTNITQKKSWDLLLRVPLHEIQGMGEGVQGPEANRHNVCGIVK